MIKDFLLRKMLASKLKGVPQAEQEKLLALIQKNPEIFQRFAGEVQAKVIGGKDQMTAITEVMKEHESELKDLIK